MSRPRRPGVLAAALLIIGIGGGGAAFLRYRMAGSTQSATVRRGPIVEAVYGLGTVASARTYQLRLGITTSLREAFVREGDRIEKGVPLVRLDEGLVQKAPFRGTVTSVAYKAGETVFPQSPVLMMMDLENLYVVVALEQQGALRVRKEQKALLSFESLRGRRVEGKVRTVFPSDGQFIVHIETAEPLPAGILPGMTADVAIEVGKRDDAILIPLAAVSAGKVLVERDGKRVKTDVRLGNIDGQWAEVVSEGLREGDTLLIPARGR